MQYEIINMLSKVSNKHTQYVKLNQLPTQFRAYPENTNIYVRRLNMQESFDLTQVDDTDPAEFFEALARVYEDAIISDNPDFTLYDLEIVDFQLAIAVSTIWSSKKAGWNLSINCPNAFCGKHIQKEVTLDDFNFQDNVSKLPIPVRLDNIDFNVRTLTVGKIIQINREVAKDSTLKRGILEFAYMLEPMDKSKFNSVIDIYNFLRFVDDEDYEALRQIDRDITVLNYPIVVKCPHCGKEVKVNKQLKDLKAYL